MLDKNAKQQHQAVILPKKLSKKAGNMFLLLATIGLMQTYLFFVTLFVEVEGLLTKIRPLTRLVYKVARCSGKTIP